MTGDYGSGKSSFALLLAHWFAGNDSPFPPQIRKVVNFHRFGVKRPHFVPVLVTCSKQALGMTILKSLHQTVSQIYGRGKKSKLAVELEQLLGGKKEPSDDQVLNALLEVNSRIIADSKGNGLILILDELGKFFEFAALHPQRQDVFLLQRLAETASRSGNEPLFVVCLLHQGFNAYADYLNQSAQREWEKVAGRFDEIVFNQPVEQIAYLISSALNVNTDQLPRAADSRPETCNGACPCARLVRLCKREGIARLGGFALSVASDHTAGANSHISAIRTKRTVAFQFPAVE